MSRKFRWGGLILVCALVFSSCGSAGGDQQGVGVRSINTDVGLGVEVQLGAPANVVVEQTQRRRPDQRPPRFTLPPIVQPTAAPTRPCPAAGPFDFPAEETGTVAQGRPKPGNYAWKIEGRAYGSAGVEEIDQFETRTIADVQDDPASSDAFSFKQTQTFLIDDRRGAGTLTTTFRVVPTSPGQTDTTRSDAGRGVFIVSIVFNGKDEEGRNITSEFNPVPAVQIMGFPVKDGGGVAGSTPTQTGARPVESSAGTDPGSGAQLRVTGTVKGKKQVDACGQRIDSWFTDAQQTFTYTDDRTGQTQTLESNYDYAIAPQFGGMLVSEHTEAPLEGPAIVVDARIGQVPE
jgi:hypothetical protein